MPRGKERKKKTETEPQLEEEDAHSNDPDFIEGVNDQEEEIRAQLPSQEHCHWLVNIIQIHSRKIAKELLREHEKTHQQQTSHELDTLKKKIHDMELEVEILKSDILKKQRRIERLEYVNSKRETETRNLTSKLDDFEQGNYDQYIQVVGLPENKDETDDVKQFTKMVKEKTGVKIKPTDIVEMKRMGKKKDSKARNVTVKFKDIQSRQKIYDERKKLIKPGNPSQSLYLNDYLTKYRQNLLYASRQLVKGKKIYAAWSQHGNVLVRKEENSEIIHIHDSNDLMKIKTIDSGQDQKSRAPSDETNDEVSHLSDYDFYYDSDM